MANNKVEIGKSMVLISQIGLSMSTPIIVGVFLGSKLDNYFGTQPLFLILLLFVFSFASFINLFKLAGVKKTNKKNIKSNQDINDKK